MENEILKVGDDWVFASVNRDQYFGKANDSRFGPKRKQFELKVVIADQSSASMPLDADQLIELSEKLNAFVETLKKGA